MDLEATLFLGRGNHMLDGCYALLQMLFCNIMCLTYDRGGALFRIMREIGEKEKHENQCMNLD
jgi:hypothetical protein